MAIEDVANNGAPVTGGEQGIGQSIALALTGNGVVRTSAPSSPALATSNNAMRLSPSPTMVMRPTRPTSPD